MQLDLDNKEMELIELRLLQGPKKSLHMAHLYETDSITEQEYVEVFTALQSSQHRIRKLEVRTYDDSEWGDVFKSIFNNVSNMRISFYIQGMLK